MEGRARASIRNALENAQGLDDGEGFDETIIEAAGGKEAGPGDVAIIGLAKRI